MNTNGNKPGRAGDEDMRNQLEVLRLMEQYREDAPEETVPLVKAAPEKKVEPRQKRSVKEVLTGILYAIIPVAGDPPREILRKIIFVAALLTLIGSCGYIVNDMVIQPAIVAGVTDDLKESSENPPELTPEEEAFNYPEGMLDSYKKLYYLNQDLYGWITYTATSSNKWLDISYPVMHAVDNDYYLRKDYYGNYCKTGTLFIDYRNDPSRNGTNKNTIIYGHNSAS
ncbi:MAG: class B sortase, partial [Clostridia bacterium]|nr:class B sortase [Clostridia bacterium]